MRLHVLMMIVVVVATVLGLSCAPDEDRSPATRPVPSEDTKAAADPNLISIESNTQATIDDRVRIGAGNFREGDYTAATGEQRRGRSAALWISLRDAPGERADQALRVGAGSRFSAGELTFDVLQVSDDVVRLRRVKVP